MGVIEERFQFLNEARAGQIARLPTLFSCHTFSRVNNSEQSDRERRLELAQKAFKDFYAQCFWSADPNLEIREENIPFVIRGLRYHGGHLGYRIAAELCR